MSTRSQQTLQDGIEGVVFGASVNGSSGGADFTEESRQRLFEDGKGLLLARQGDGIGFVEDVDDGAVGIDDGNGRQLFGGEGVEDVDQARVEAAGGEVGEGADAQLGNGHLQQLKLGVGSEQVVVEVAQDEAVREDGQDGVLHGADDGHPVDLEGDQLFDGLQAHGFWRSADQPRVPLAGQHGAHLFQRQDLQPHDVDVPFAPFLDGLADFVLFGFLRLTFAH